MDTEKNRPDDNVSKGAKADDTAAKRKGSDTRAIRAKVAQAVARKRCAYCGQVAFRVDCTKGKIRYLICRGCGRREQLVIEDDKGNGKAETKEV